MKKIILTIAILVVTTAIVYAQSDVTIHDTRDINDLPNFSPRKFRLDFKRASTIGIGGNASFSTNMTISPWSDASGGLVHQLSFNNGRIFYRTGVFDAPSWDSWGEIVVKDSQGSISSYFDIPTINVDVRDNFTYNQKTMGHYSLGWYLDSSSSEGPTMWLSSWGGVKVFTQGKPRMMVNFVGNVGIGTTSPDYKLDVVGTIRAHQLLVNTQKGADFVFEDGYSLRSLEEVEQFITENKHLPDIASASSMEQNGVNMGELQIQLLQKIEELTLYTIEQNKQIQELTLYTLKQEEKINRLEEKINSKTQ